MDSWCGNVITTKANIESYSKQNDATHRNKLMCCRYLMPPTKQNIRIDLNAKHDRNHERASRETLKCHSVMTSDDLFSTGVINNV